MQYMCFHKFVLSLSLGKKKPGLESINTKLYTERKIRPKTNKIIQSLFLLFASASMQEACPFKTGLLTAHPEN